MSRGFICHPYLVPAATETFDSVAELPRSSADPGALPTVTGSTFTVSSGGNIQTALNSAAAADGALNHEIVIEAGATFTGAFTLPNRSGTNPSGTGWIIVRSANLSSLPANERVVPADTANMPLIRSTTNDTIIFTTASTARNYRLAGLEIAFSAAVTSASVAVSLDQTSTRIIVDRCYVHTNSTGNFMRGVALNCDIGAVMHSYISGWHHAAADAQAVWLAYGTGPYLIYNNYLEGSGENILVGGSDPPTANRTPSDITVRHNHFSKPTSWRSGGTNTYSIKNVFELKNAKRVLLENNILEQWWVGGQWEAIVLKSVNQDGGAAWCQTADVTVRYNIVRSGTAGFNITYAPESGVNPVTAGTKRLSIHDNLCYDIGDFNGTSNGRMFTMGDVDAGFNDIIINRNTFVHSATNDMLDIFDGGGAKGTNLQITNNIATLGDFGIFGNGGTTGSVAMSTWWNSPVLSGNVFINVSSISTTNYASDTIVAATTDVFTNPGADNYTPIGSGVGKGCDYPTVLARTANVIAGTP